MSRLKLALALSLLVNAGVLGGVLYQSLGGAAERFPGLPAYLDLSDAQRARWEVLERDFMQGLRAVSREVALHRERLIRGALVEQADAAALEAERAAIAALQAEQQKHVIAQLLREREILDAAQRAKLAALLLEQAPAGALPIERLHRD